MLKSKPFKAFLLIAAIVFCLSLTGVSADPCPDCPPNISTIQGTVEYPEGWRLKWGSPVYPNDKIDRGGIKTISVVGGLPPYIWTVNNNGFWLDQGQTNDLDNVINADNTGDCVATITVVDKRGEEATGYVRLADGHWQTIGNDCVIPGPMTLRVDGYTWERVEGQYRQEQRISNRNHFLGTCLYVEPPCGNQSPYSCNPAPDPGTECIDVISTGLVGDSDRQEYPCFWSSPIELPYCTDRGSPGMTSMYCITTGIPM